MPNDTSSKSSRRDVSFEELSARCFQNANLSWHRLSSNCGDIEHRTSAQGRVIYTGEHGNFLIEECGTRAADPFARLAKLDIDQPAGRFHNLTNCVFFIHLYWYTGIYFPHPIYYFLLFFSLSLLLVTQIVLLNPRSSRTPGGIFCGTLRKKLLSKKTMLYYQKLLHNLPSRTRPWRRQQQPQTSTPITACPHSRIIL